MFEVSVDEMFSAGHALRGYKGKCENPHGHNYKVRVVLEGPDLNSIGLLYDFIDVKKIMRAIIEGLDHKFLNDQAPFDKVNPSAENLAKYFYDQTLQGMREISENSSNSNKTPKIASVTVWETDFTFAVFRP
ncbi:MAG: 6-carboxytetrahydropterin synthase QueD [Candidatus Acidiferrales bacterium]